MSPSYGGFLVTLFKIGNIYSHLAFTISSILFSFYPPKHSLHSAAAAAAKLLQLCPTLCDPIDGSPPGSPVPGILQARTLEWVAISSSNAWKWKVKVKSLSRVRLLATPWTAAYQAHQHFSNFNVLMDLFGMEPELCSSPSSQVLVHATGLRGTTVLLSNRVL